MKSLYGGKKSLISDLMNCSINVRSFATKVVIKKKINRSNIQDKTENQCSFKSHAAWTCFQQQLEKPLIVWRIAKHHRLPSFRPALIYKDQSVSQFSP